MKTLGALAEAVRDIADKPGLTKEEKEGLVRTVALIDWVDKFVRGVRG